MATAILPRQVLDQDDWDAHILALPHPHPLQSRPWAEHKRLYGWTPAFWLFEQEGRPRGAALILRRRASPLPVGVLYLPKGPLLDDWGDANLVEAVLAHLESVARREHAVFIKIDPDVDYPPAPDFCAPHGPEVVARLERRGWRFSPDQIQYRNTVLVDLRPTEEELLGRMKPKTRYNIRLAERHGVTVSPGDASHLPAYYALYEETSARDGFLIREYDYYRSVWERFLARGYGHLLLASVEGEIVAGLFLFLFGRRAWYMYGASGEQHRNLMPNHLLQWEAMRLARAQACTAYDMWGAPDELVETDPMWGVYRFKAGFGGEFVRHIGAYDYPTSAPLYRLYMQAIPRYLALLRRLRGTGTELR